MTFVTVSVRDAAPGREDLGSWATWALWREIRVIWVAIAVPAGTVGSHLRFRVSSHTSTVAPSTCSEAEPVTANLRAS